MHKTQVGHQRRQRTHITPKQDERFRLIESKGIRVPRVDRVDNEARATLYMPEDCFIARIEGFTLGPHGAMKQKIVFRDELEDGSHDDSVMDMDLLVEVTAELLGCDRRSAMHAILTGDERLRRAGWRL